MAQSFLGATIPSTIFAETASPAEGWVEKQNYEYKQPGSVNGAFLTPAAITTGSRTAAAAITFTSTSYDGTTIDSTLTVQTATPSEGWVEKQNYEYKQPGSVNGAFLTFTLFTGSYTHAPQFIPPPVTRGRALLGSPISVESVTPTEGWVTKRLYEYKQPGSVNGAFLTFDLSSGPINIHLLDIPEENFVGSRIVSMSDDIRDRIHVFTDQFETYEVPNSFDTGDMSLTPAPPAGSVVWLRADAGVTVDGFNNVGSWTDQSGTGNHATQSNPSRKPLLVTNSINGKPVIRFSTSDLQIPRDVSFDQVTEFTTFCMMRPGTAPGVLMCRDDQGAQRVWRIEQEDVTIPRFGYHIFGTNNGGVDVGFTSRAGLNYLFGFTYVNSAGVHTRKAFVNGLRRQEDPTITGTFPNSLTANIAIGSTTNEAEFFNGDIAEVIIYPGKLTDDELRTLSYYFYTRYFITYDPDNVVKRFKLWSGFSDTRELTRVVGQQDTGIVLSVTPPLNQKPGSSLTVDVTVQDNGAGDLASLLDFQYRTPLPVAHGYINFLAANRALTEPASQPTALVFSNITQTTVDLSWTAATPFASGYIVFRRRDLEPTAIPVDGTAYVAGDDLGDSRIVFVGHATTFTDILLAPNSLYHYEIFSFNGSVVSGFNYRQAFPLRGSVTTLQVDQFQSDTSSFTDDRFCGNAFRYTPCDPGPKDVVTVYPDVVTAPSFITVGPRFYSLVGSTTFNVNDDTVDIVDRDDTAPALTCNDNVDPAGSSVVYTPCDGSPSVSIRFPRTDLGIPLFGAVAVKTDPGDNGLTSGEIVRQVKAITLTVIDSVAGTGILELNVSQAQFPKKVFVLRGGIRTDTVLGPGASVARLNVIPGDRVGIDVSNEARKVDPNLRDKVIIVRWRPVPTFPRLYESAVVNLTGSSSIRAVGFTGYSNRSKYAMFASLPFDGTQEEVNPDSILTVLDFLGTERVLIRSRAAGDQPPKLPVGVPMYAGEVLTGPLTFKFWTGRELLGQHGEMDVWFDTDQSFPQNLQLDQYRGVAVSSPLERQISLPTDVDRNSIRIGAGTPCSAESVPSVYVSETGQRIVVHIAPPPATVIYQGMTYELDGPADGGAYVVLSASDVS